MHKLKQGVKNFLKGHWIDHKNLVILLFISKKKYYPLLLNLSRKQNL